MNTIRQAVIAVLLTLLVGCGAKQPDLKGVDYVDLERFMGDWYVIANIPTFLEKGAHNAVETYALNEDGTIDTTFVFRDEAFDGKRKEYNPKGFVKDDGSNDYWGMRFIWPIKADYRIVYLDEEYSQTIIARQKRDFIWIMARTPEISDEDYDRLIEFSASIGYDVDKIERVPQSW